MNTNKKGLFTLPDGRKMTVTFFLVTSLFLIWGFCNGMIDTMDKHFQDQLHLTKAQSAWVQFAHYMGYALMALPAGLLTRRVGYKGGIIFGLMLVAAGGFWFLPATHISQFWAFLTGVCLIAMGLTVLETVANPYTTLLGPKEYGPTRINLAQSFNGVGWIFGPIVGGAYFYSKDGVEVAHGQLYVPYLGVGVVVLVIAALFYFAQVPDIKVEDAYHTDDTTPPTEPVAKEKNPTLIFAMMFLNVAAVGLSIYLILYTLLPGIGVSEQVIVNYFPWIVGGIVLLAVPKLRSTTKNVTAHSIWAHPHFSSATLAQFLYVAAQAGIFSFFINTMTVDKKTGYCLVPPIPASWNDAMISASASVNHLVESLPGFLGWFIHWLPNWLLNWFSAGPDCLLHISDRGAANLSSVGFIFFLIGRVIGAALLKKFPAHKVLGTFATLNVIVCGLIISQLGWISVFCVFLSYFFMSIMFPTIFALGIFGLGAESKKKASAFIVMSITGGALMPKFMGHLGDVYNMAAAFWMPFVCFILIGIYGFFWSKLSQAEDARGGSLDSH
jgi:FHS family L-fucose permease-like MFS transporter